MHSRLAVRACCLTAVASSRSRGRSRRLEYANSFEAGDRLAGWSRADSNIGPDSVTNTVYLYAASGCTTGVVSRLADGTERRVSYTWTDDYRLASVSVDGAAVAEYAYDVLGNLVAVATTDESFEILVDNGHSLADVAADGRTLRVYMRAPGVDNWLGFVDMTGSLPVPYFYVTDHLGSVLAVTDANGNLVERYEYDAWGKVISVTDANGNALARSAIGNRILWQAREYSWTTGLYYFRNRWYDPVVGRWISKDPIGIQGGINLYEFCDGSVSSSIDPFGYARIKTRRLDIGGSRPFSRINLLGNVDPRHREIFFEDGEDCKNHPASVGYGPDGVHKDASGIPYNNTEYRHYDDKLMRAAVETVVKTGKWTPEKYNFFTHNCQDFVAAVIKEYNKLEHYHAIAMA